MTAAPGQRLHALDNLRAVMMWLGIVLHVAAMHTVGPTPLPWRDPAGTPLADLLMAFIHTFRMPVFFIVAGFFVAMLAQQRGTGAMLKHRFRRIALPFLVFWPPILIGTMWLATLFFHVAVHGRIGLDAALVPRNPAWPVVNTLHLWFIWLLWWFAVLAAAARWIASRLPEAWRDALPRLLRRLGRTGWGAPLLALPLAGVGALHPFGVVAPSGSLLPHWTEWVHNGLFFAAGYALWGTRESLLPLYQRRAWLCAAAGLPWFLAAGALVRLPQSGIELALAPALTAFTYTLASWLWSAAAIGLFMRYVARRQPVLAYLADSAYWVYLVHLPLTVAFGALLYAAPLTGLAKMALNIGLTTAACLASYHVFVRGRWIGRLLNGQREPQRRLGPPVSAAWIR